MRRPVLLGVIAVVVIAAVAAFVITRNHTPAPAPQNTAMNMNMSPSNNAGAASTPVATNSVTIQNFAFSPADITVKAGTKVTWTNQDNVAHTVTETDSQAGPKSSALDFGSSYNFTFTQPGTYHYHCAIHPQMTGTVTVTS